MEMRFTGTKCLSRHWEYFPWFPSLDTGNVMQDFLKIFPVSGRTLNGVKLLGICWEILRIMQMRCSGAKNLIRHREYLSQAFPL